MNQLIEADCFLRAAAYARWKSACLRKRAPAIEWRGVLLDGVLIEEVPGPRRVMPDLRTIGCGGRNSGLISKPA
jgi:hypothetical protein